MSPKYRRQNRNVCDLVLIFSQNQRLFFLEVKLYRSPSFQVLWSLPWQDQAVFNFLGRFQGHIVCGCWQALNHASIALVTKYRQLANLKTTFSDEKFFLIAIKKLHLKCSLSWGYNLRKRIVLVLLTAVDLIRRSTPRYYACCVTRQCLFRIHFFAFQSLSECPNYLYN